MGAKTSYNMRIIHRYLGFFLAGIMAMYALSGIVLIFRDTDSFKITKAYSKQVTANLGEAKLGEEIGVRRLQVERQEGDILYFKEGTYNKVTGQADYAITKLPLLLDKMTHLHKAKASQPLYFFNIFFGLALLFFVISSFWMFMPSTSVFKKGVYFALAGMVLTALLLFV